MPPAAVEGRERSDLCASIAEGDILQRHAALTGKTLAHTESAVPCYQDFAKAGVLWRDVSVRSDPEIGMRTAHVLCLPSGRLSKICQSIASLYLRQKKSARASARAEMFSKFSAYS
jgi:hypothetical protein